MKNMKEDIDAICANLIDNSEPVSEMVFDLFNRTKKFANRRPSSLMADCIYIIMNAIGNPVSITLLSYVIKETLESKKAILEVIEEEDIYDSVMRFQNKG